MPGVIGTCVAAYLFHSNLAVIFTGGVGKNGSSVAVSVIDNEYLMYVMLNMV